MAESVAPIGVCRWPWSHEWSRWEVLVRGRGTDILVEENGQELVHRNQLVEIQRRECFRCGMSQLREFRS